MKRESENTAIYTAYEDFEGFDPVSPEKNLLLAILLTAMNDLKREGPPAKKAREYLLSSEEDYVFSFRSVCHYLNVDASKILKIAGVETVDNDSCSSGLELTYPY